MVSGPEITAIVHGFLGTVFLMAFAGAFAELVEITNSGIKRLKIGVTLMAASIIITALLGDLVYTVYRAPVPESARSVILAGPTPWVHTVLMELKEHIAHFVPLLLIAVAFMVFYYDKDLLEKKELRYLTTALLVFAMLITLLVFGLGAYITKVKPI
ncbi:MAG: hypothetical protein AABX51_02470 [Nanoarchaeota archaeon]